MCSIPTVTLYSQPVCSGCTFVKKALAANNVPHVVVDITQDDAAYKELKDAGITGTPVLKHAGTFYPGIQDQLDFAKQWHN